MATNLQHNWANSCDLRRGSSHWPNNSERWESLKKNWTKQRIWGSQGAAYDAFQGIELAIKEATRELKVRRSGKRHQLKKQVLRIECCMVGKTYQEARPCIMVTCRSRAVFKPAKVAIVSTQEWRELQELYPNCYNVYATLPAKPPPRLVGPTLHQSDSPISVLYCPSLSQATYGAAIYFKHSGALTKGTMGGFAMIGKKVYGYTAAHCALPVHKGGTAESEYDDSDTDDISYEELELLYPLEDVENGETCEDDRLSYRASFDADSGVSIPAMSIVSMNSSKIDVPPRVASPETQHLPDEVELEILGHVEHSWTTAKEVVDCALIQITSTRFLMHLARQSVDRTSYLKNTLTLVIDPTGTSQGIAAPDVLICVEGTEYQGSIDAHPTLMQITEHEEMVSLTEVTIPAFCFRKYYSA